MNKKDEAQKLMQEGKALIERAEALLNQPSYEPVIGWKPELDQEYWFSDRDGVESYVYAGDKVDDGIIDSHQIFPTEELALTHREREVARLKVLRRIEELNEGWEPDFDNNNTLNYYIFCGHRDISLRLDFSFNSQYLETAEYCRTREIAQQVIDELDDEWKLWKGVK